MSLFPHTHSVKCIHAKSFWVLDLGISWLHYFVVFREFICNDLIVCGMCENVYVCCCVCARVCVVCMYVCVVCMCVYSVCVCSMYVHVCM